MNCPKCGKRSKVVDSESMQSGGKPVVIRNRVCIPCKITIRTHEQVVTIYRRAFHAAKNKS